MLCRGTALSRLLGPDFSLDFCHYDGAFGGKSPTHAQWEESLSKHLWFAIVIVFFWLKWAGYLAVAGLNLLVQISDRISPFGV